MHRLPDEVTRLNKYLNEFSYMLPNNGYPIYEISEEDYYTKYKYLTVEEFEKYRGGVCWDYVRYESEKLKEIPDISLQTFYVQLSDNSTHTFILVDSLGDSYWIESSWKPLAGTYMFTNEDQALRYIIKKMIEFKESEENSNITSFQIFEFDPEDIESGSSCEEYMEYFENKIPLKFSSTVNQLKNCIIIPKTIL